MAASLDSGDWIRKIFHVADFCVTFIRRMRQRSSEKFLCLSVASAVRLTSWFWRARRPFQSAQRQELRSDCRSEGLTIKRNENLSEVYSAQRLGWCAVCLSEV